MALGPCKEGAPPPGSDREFECRRAKYMRERGMGLERDELSFFLDIFSIFIPCGTMTYNILKGCMDLNGTSSGYQMLILRVRGLKWHMKTSI